MHNEFVSYEIALKLKELGFDKPCLTYYYELTSNLRTHIGVDIGNAWTYSENKKLGFTLAPLYQQVFRWFREQFNWQSSIEATNDQHSHKLGYNHFIWNNITGEEYHTMPKDSPFGDWCFKTYEEAQKECILDLISIIKNQKK
jgi:hypothetical protein